MAEHTILITQDKLNAILSERVARVRARYGADLIDEMQAALSEAVTENAQLRARVAELTS